MIKKAVWKILNHWILQTAFYSISFSQHTHPLKQKLTAESLTPYYLKFQAICI